MKRAHAWSIVAAVIIMAALLTACPNGGEAPGTEATIATFIFEAANNDALSADVTAPISTDGTVTAAVPHGTAVTALVPTITLPAGATVAPASGVAQDFTDPVTYTVTAEDGETSADFTVTVTVAAADASTACDITSFVFEAAENTALSEDVTGAVGSGTVTAEVRFGTDITALVPTITISDAATVDPATGTAQNFSSSVTYTVTAEDAATTQEYTVTVSETDAVIVGGNVFQELSLDGIVTTAAGAPGHVAHYDGTGAGALLWHPRYGVAAGEYIYFTEENNSAIRRLDPETNTVTTFSGTTGTAGYTEGAADTAQFNHPAGLATDGTYLYVADEYNHVIRRVSLADGSVDTLAGTGISGFTDGDLASAQFSRPIDLCYHDGYLYVADEWNYRIRTVDLTTDQVTTLAGTGDQNHEDGTGTDPATGAEFYNPRGIAFDGTYLWVTDYQTVRRVTLGGLVETVCGSDGDADYRDDLGTAARFNEPNSIIAGPGTLYIGDANNDAIRKIDTTTDDFAVTTLAGDYQNGGVKDGTHTDAWFHWPYLIGLFDSDLYAADYSSHTLRHIDIGTRVVTTIAGTDGEDHDADDAGYFIDGSGVGALCESVNGAATDGEYLYFTERSANLVRRMNLETGTVTTLAGEYGEAGTDDGPGSVARFNWPRGITMVGGDLYVCDSSNNTIRRIDLDTLEVSTFAGSGSSGSGDGEGTAASFDAPSGITNDGTNLYVTDELNHTIRKIVIADATVTTLAGEAKSSGQADGDGSDARFDRPKGITTDGTYLYVADNFNYTIRRIDPATAEVTTYAGAADTPGYSNDKGTAARFSGPSNLACDGANLYVSDEHELRRIDLDTADVTLVAGDTNNAAWADGTGMDARFEHANGLACDGTDLWVMDSNNHVIRRVE